MARYNYDSSKEWVMSVVANLELDGNKGLQAADRVEALWTTKGDLQITSSAGMTSSLNHSQHAQ